MGCRNKITIYNFSFNISTHDLEQYDIENKNFRWKYSKSAKTNGNH